MEVRPPNTRHRPLLWNISYLQYLYLMYLLLCIKIFDLSFPNCQKKLLERLNRWVKGLQTTPTALEYFLFAIFVFNIFVTAYRNIWSKFSLLSKIYIWGTQHMSVRPPGTRLHQFSFCLTNVTFYAVFWKRIKNAIIFVI